MIWDRQTDRQTDCLRLDGDPVRFLLPVRVRPTCTPTTSFKSLTALFRSNVFTLNDSLS
jgi:hypothetical protein